MIYICRFGKFNGNREMCLCKYMLTREITRKMTRNLMILTVGWIAAVSCACNAGMQDSPQPAEEIVPTVANGWVVEADDYEAAYTGVPVANGILGILPWKEPFSVRHIMLNNVSERLGPDQVNRTVRGINPFGLSMEVDGNAEYDISDWRQRIDMKNAEHVTEFAADGKVMVRYSFTALRNLPYSMLLRVEVTAVEDVAVEFRNRMSVPEEYGAAESRRHDKEDQKHEDGVDKRRQINARFLFQSKIKHRHPLRFACRAFFSDRTPARDNCIPPLLYGSP